VRRCLMLLRRAENYLLVCFSISVVVFFFFFYCCVIEKFQNQKIGVVCNCPTGFGGRVCEMAENPSMYCFYYNFNVF
jgi:hypothetical protein